MQATRRAVSQGSPRAPRWGPGGHAEAAAGEPAGPSQQQLSGASGEPSPRPLDAPRELERDPAERDSELWLQYHEQRQQSMASHDRLAACVLLLMLMVAAWRKSKSLTPVEVLQCTMLLSMVLTVLAVAGSEEYWPKRRAYLSVLRVAAALSPLLEAHTLSHMEAQQGELPKNMWAVFRVLLRMLFGDDATLLSFLCMAWYVGGTLELVVQLVTLGSMMRRNAVLCASPYLSNLASARGITLFHEQVQAASKMLNLPVHRTFASLPYPRACQLYVMALQLICGCIAPVLFHLCQHIPDARRFAREHGISPGNSRFRRLSTADDYLCSANTRVLRVAAALPLTAGVLIMLTDLFAPTHQQAASLTPSNLVDTAP